MVSAFLLGKIAFDYSVKTKSTMLFILYDMGTVVNKTGLTRPHLGETTR